MPFLPFLIVIGIAIVTIQKIATDAPIAGTACVILIFLVAISIANLSNKKKALQESTRRAIISEFKWTDNIDPLEFERRCAEAMQLSGWTAQTTKSTGDQGADVIAGKRGAKVVLQCKRYTNTVVNKAVQEVFAAKTFLGANFAAVVSNNSYTRSAKELAVKTGVLLLDYSQLREANLLFGFPDDGVPPLQYQSGVTPSDVKRAQRYVMVCMTASVPVFLIALGFDAAHNNQPSSRASASTIAATHSANGTPTSAQNPPVDTAKPTREGGELSPIPPPSLDKASTEYTPPPVITDEDKRNWHLSTAREATPDPSSIESQPAELRTIARAASLPAGLSQTFREMVIRSGRSCAMITDHVWVNATQISLMCDRRLRIAFVREPQGWRFARPAE
jgi:HJR/Mrr/RecB family endonuclease